MKFSVSGRILFDEYTPKFSHPNLTICCRQTNWSAYYKIRAMVVSVSGGDVAPVCQPLFNNISAPSKPATSPFFYSWDTSDAKVLGGEGQTWWSNIASRRKNERFVLLETKTQTPESIAAIIKTISMTVCDNMLIWKQVCVNTVDCNTWLHIMKHIVKAIRPPECD